MSGVDREFAGPEQSIGAMQARLDALEARVGAGLARRPTGDVEASMRTTAKDGTLILNGQLVSRTTYAALWKWAQDQGLVIAGRFTAGDGSTTFGLPDLRGRVLLGAGTLGADTYAAGTTGGAAAQTLATGNLPAHTHGPHSHPFTTGASGGNHGNHNQDYFNAAGGTISTFTATGPFGNEAHVHTGTTDSATPSSVGSATPTPVDVRQPYNAVNYLIWT